MTGPSILIIDDNHLNLELLHFLFTNNGYNVQQAINAKEALVILETFKPAVILMDLQLPDMDGYQLTKILKSMAKFKSTPIIAITAYAMKGDREKALAAGCDEYVSKPIDTRTLPTTIAKYIRVEVHEE